MPDLESKTARGQSDRALSCLVTLLIKETIRISFAPRTNAHSGRTKSSLFSIGGIYLLTRGDLISVGLPSDDRCIFNKIISYQEEFSLYRKYFLLAKVAFLYLVSNSQGPLGTLNSWTSLSTTKTICQRSHDTLPGLEPEIAVGGPQGHGPKMTSLGLSENPGGHWMPLLPSFLVLSVLVSSVVVFFCAALYMFSACLAMASRVSNVLTD